MTERASLLGGSLHAGPDPDGGWTVNAVLDIRMPEVDGIEATRQLAGPDVADPLATQLAAAAAVGSTKVS